MHGGIEVQTETTDRKGEGGSSPTMRRDPRGRLIVHIPMSFKKRGGRKEIVLPPGHSLDDDQAGPSINKPLAIAVALGHRWLDLLAEDQFHSVGELADVVGMDPSQLRRHLSLACLSPRLVRAILDGKEPNGMSVEKLKEISIRWDEQV